MNSHSGIVFIHRSAQCCILGVALVHWIQNMINLIDVLGTWKFSDTRSWDDSDYILTSILETDIPHVSNFCICSRQVHGVKFRWKRRREKARPPSTRHLGQERRARKKFHMITRDARAEKVQICVGDNMTHYWKLGCFHLAVTVKPRMRSCWRDLLLWMLPCWMRDILSSCPDFAMEVPETKGSWTSSEPTRYLKSPSFQEPCWDFAMEALQLRSGVSLPTLRRQELPFSRHCLGRFRCRPCWSKLQTGDRISADTVLLRARRGNGGEEVGVSEEEGGVGAKRRPLWQRAWGLGGRALGFGETWKEDHRGQRELEELDSFLEGSGADFRWKDVLDPSVENVLALVLTGLFLYAIVLIGWQLLLVAAAITLSALKYAVIAAIVLGVLIFFIWHCPRSFGLGFRVLSRKIHRSKLRRKIHHDPA